MSSRNSKYYSTSAMFCLALASMSCCDVSHGLIVGHNHQRPFLQRRTLGASSRSTFRRHQRHHQQQRPHRSSSSSMSMYLDDLPSMATHITNMNIPSLPSLTSLTSSIPQLLLASDPKLEAELLTDVSHVALDFTTLFLSPSTAWLRFCNVFGRILIMSSDYIQDDYITPDEWFFQSSMLVISTQMLLRSVWPVLLAAVSTTALTVRDRRAYTEVFDRVGLTVLQFRTLLTSKALSWVEVPCGEELELDGDVCFLYSGKVMDSASNVVFSDEDWRHIGNRIFGEVQFSKAMEASMYKNIKNKKSSRDGHHHHHHHYHTSTISKKDKRRMIALEELASSTTDSSSATSSSLDNLQGKLTACGPNGAVLLRISTSKLLELMTDDEQLAGSIHRLVLLSMQDKLSRAYNNISTTKEERESSGNSAIKSSSPSSTTSNSSNVFQANFSSPIKTSASKLNVTIDVAYL